MSIILDIPKYVNLILDCVATLMPGVEKQGWERMLLEASASVAAVFTLICQISLLRFVRFVHLCTLILSIATPLNTLYGNIIQ